MQPNYKAPLSFRILRQLGVAWLMFVVLATPLLARAQTVDPVNAAIETAETVTLAADKAGTVASQVAKQSLSHSVTMFLINLMTYAADKAAYEAAVRVATAGPGGTSLFTQDAWDGYFDEVAGASAANALDLLSEEISGSGGMLKNFNLCDPGNVNVTLAFKFGIKSVFKPEEPKCEIKEVVGNWKGFVADASQQFAGGDARNQFVLTQLADAFDPNTNEFSVGINLTSSILNKSWSDANLKKEQRIANDGFNSPVDIITGQVKTPASMVRDDFSQNFKKPDDIAWGIANGLLQNSDALLQVGVHAGSVFTNTLLSKLAERVYTGLFEIDPSLINVDPFDPNSFAQSGSDSSISSLRAIFTAAPLQITNYSILQEFGACPTSNRGLYNCVADSALISAVARASSGSAVTVQEAMDDGLLKPDWPLIPSSDQARNQDSFCYSYGYCYGNLVKLRKARVISIGWEFAANSEFNSANDPATLREVVQGFNNCNDAGQPDADHPWCKLIDPNWVLKYPQTQCRADVNGQLLVAKGSSERQTECVDMPSCIAEDENGNCTGGYGYCVREENVWQFRGQSCPKEFASCITVKNDEKTVSYLRNTTDPGPCSEDNAGCQWYVNNKSADGAGSFIYPDITSVASADTDPNAYKQRTYFTGQVEECDAENGGCRELVVRNDGLSLNMVINPGFEKNVDANTLPDGWNFAGGTPLVDTTSAYSRSGVAAMKAGSAIAYETAIEFSQSRFYTMSFYARQEAAGGTGRGQLYVGFNADDGSSVELAGTSKSASANAQSCDFSDGNGDGRMDAVTLTGVPSGITHERFTCTFTSPTLVNSAARLFAFVDVMPGQAWVDDLQIEQGPAVTNYHDGYSSSTLPKKVVKVPPTYLGCTGAATDPAECAGYAKVCSENDAGCTAYTPANGDPAVTGVVSELDYCSPVCVGYDTYKQEATRYEPNGIFPLYFIPDTARSCRAQDVGCDEFTNLADESKEYFTYVRACVTPVQAEANIASDNAATFYTWEGSDNSGYQLKTWNLLQSNLGPTPRTYTVSGEIDSVPSDAPCVNWTSTVNGITCADTYEWEADATCDEHGDIFTNSDCREFYDANGVIHYRTWLDTVTVDASCANYRKTDIAGATAADRQLTCTTSGGFFDLAAGTCRYNGLTSESRTCGAAANGCREYTGGRSRNSRQAYEDLFEGGDLTRWTAAVPTSIVLSNESLATGGHSLLATASFKTAPGVLDGDLFTGKTYTLSFLAKGSGTVAPGFDYSAVTAPGVDVSFGSADLTSGWQEYSFGPLDMNAAGFGDGTALAFVPSATVYIDNVVLREGQDNITLIKDSWVTPAVCDQTPNGAAAPQYELGCQEYSDQNGSEVSLKSFSRLCGEDKVGCASFFMTQESESPHAEVHNATCSLLTVGAATSTTPCYYGRSGASYDITTPLLCTIGVGYSECTFKMDWYVAPANLPAHLRYAPSTVITPADKDLFLVVTDDVTCSNDAKGCTEYGLPTYNQARTATTGATSKFFKNDPSAYADTLCTGDALFCSAWTGTGGTQYYFKDPGTKTCEYKTNVTVDGSSYDGWFKTGTSEFCYNAPRYVIGGNLSGIWRNGDIEAGQYDGWVGTCGAEYNSCAEYQDPLAVETNEIYSNTDGSAYFSLTSSLTSTRSSVTGTDCNGQVSLKAGCALFNDTSVSARSFNASATEIASRHADLLFNAAPFSLVDPINCESGSSSITTPSGQVADLCGKRCVYRKSAVNDLTAAGSSERIYGTACYMADDCAIIESESGENVNAESCGDVLPGDRLKNDTNTVLAVNRDRQCSEWLSCADAQTVWDEQSNSYKTVCGQIALCTEYSAQGSSSFCSQWNFEDPKSILDSDRYTSRDVTWYGDDYSGLAIPDLFPVQALEQSKVSAEIGKCNLGPALVLGAANGGVDQAQYALYQGDDCTNDYDCENSESNADAHIVGSCPQTDEYRLVLNAGSCTGVFGSSCAVGTCSVTGGACATTDGCGSSGGSCLVGQCYNVIQGSLCTADDQCAGGQVCNGGTCATPGAEITIEAYAGVNNGCAAVQTFVPKIGLQNGTCVNQQCLLAPNGNPFALGTTESKSCKAYPETDSPFTSGVVAEWTNTETQARRTGTPSNYDVPYSSLSGFERANVCQFGEDCSCSYKKVTFGEGGQTRYFNRSYADASGICISGNKKGSWCGSDADCNGMFGSCSKATREDTILGMDGYCLERDTAININGDRDQQACINWLPVDQLAGSSDLYGKNTEAGFSQEANYCSYMSLFADVYTGVGCVEKAAAGSDKDRCINVGTTCPPGTYGIVGPWGDSSSTGQTGVCENESVSCPYLCVPVGSTNTETGASCAPEVVRGSVPIGNADGKDRGIYSFDVYWVGTTEDFDEAQAMVENCVVKGREYKPYVVETDPGDNQSLGAVASTFGLSVEALVGAADNIGWRAYQSRYRAYVGCSELAQVQEDSELSGAPWTDRLLNINAGYSLEVDSGKEQHAYTPSLKAGAFGLAPDVDTLRDRGYPAVPAQCVSPSGNGSPGTYSYVGPIFNGGVYQCAGSTQTPHELTPDLNTAEARANALLVAVLRAPNGASNDPNILTWGLDTAFVDVGRLARGVKEVLSQTFAKSVNRITYSENNGSTNLVPEAIGTPSDAADDEWDVRATEGNPPTIWAINPATCKGSECEEGPENAITLNDQNSGDISSADFLRASVKFYAAADKNQLPLRRIIMDWGDDSNPSGSEATDNFYKNHRGLQSISTNSKCDLGTEWGLTPESCDPNYLTYSHIYTCPYSLTSDPQKSCIETEGQTPCWQGSGSDRECVYQPRMHTRDNWGWCTGTCTDAGGGCYDGDGQLSGAPGFTDHCDYTSLPETPTDSQNPWIYYDGRVIVKP